jgi:hypothetical protein
MQHEPRRGPWAPCKQHQIKGNANIHIYHTPASRPYGRTKDNIVCFDTEAQARAAGYQPAKDD